MRRYTAAFILLLAFAALSTTVFAQTSTPDPAPAATPEATPEISDVTKQPVEVLRPTVLNTYPHDTGAYTEGLLLYDGFLYESTGQYAESDVRKIELETGKVLQESPIADEFFGEGLALADDRLYQLTWKEKTVFLYDRDTFKDEGELSYEGEGWGLCYDGTQLWMSDGTDTLVTRDPETFAVTREIKLTFQGYTLDQVASSDGVPFSSLFYQVNELECVGDSIYANVWLTNYILRIDAATGAITGIIQAKDLLNADELSQLPSSAVLNGIAYNPDSETFYITGKYWPKLFEVTFDVTNTINLGG